ncbi:hypothetical protein D3C80_1658130 [compost metagenome]
MFAALDIQVPLTLQLQLHLRLAQAVMEDQLDAVLARVTDLAIADTDELAIRSRGIAFSAGSIPLQHCAQLPLQGGDPRGIEKRACKQDVSCACRAAIDSHKNERLAVHQHQLRRWR